jgi:riboflavin kinase/FMN adenylyltransferase
MRSDLTAVTIGNFDGVHLGHRALIETTLQAAHSFNGRAALVTFDPHPQEVLSGKAVSRICLREQQQQLLEQTGLDEVVVIPFTKAFSGLSPEEFVMQFLVERFALRQVVVGYDFRFGKDRAGDFRLLADLGRCYDFAVQEVPPLQIAGKTVSSTLIRSLIQQHAYDQIPMYLGRSFSLAGTVVKGDQRGREIGFPTANMRVDTELALPEGVYVTSVCWRGDSYCGVTNVGKRPTFGTLQPAIETHLLDMQEDLYDEKLEVQPLHYIRGVKRFSNQDELREQISKDVRAAEQFLERRSSHV